MGPAKIPELIELFNARMDKLEKQLIEYARAAVPKQSLHSLVPDDIQKVADEFLDGLEYAEWLYGQTKEARDNYKRDQDTKYTQS